MLNGEKIDIVPYDEDPARFVANALAPAAVIEGERAKLAKYLETREALAAALAKLG